jgi:hypothetical protein
MIEVFRAHTALLQTPADRLGWEAGPVLDTIETLLFHGSEQLAVDNQRS